jgi:hypothetical protein
MGGETGGELMKINWHAIPMAIFWLMAFIISLPFMLLALLLGDERGGIR